MSSEQQQRIIGYFIEEAKDHLNTIEQGLLNLQGTIEDPEMASEIFRAAHSVKGGAAMLGLDSIQQTSHRLEDYFKVLKECPVRVDQRLETLLLRVFDTLQELLEHLQGPFGLTDDKASEVMSEVEPVFDALNQHLHTLVSQCGGVPPEDVELAPKSTPLVSSPVAALNTQPTIREESALQLIFQSDVPARLREMLQLFKQADDVDGRQQLQNICRTLIMAGEQFDLPEWCSLIEVAQLAIANPNNTYRTLAPVIIKEIKRAQEQVLVGTSTQIVVSESLQVLAPQIAPAEEPSFADFLTEAGFTEAEPSTFSDFSFAFDDPTASQFDEQLIASDEPFFESGEFADTPSEADVFNADRLADDQDWFETASNLANESAEPDLMFAADTDDEFSAFDSINIDFGELLDQESSSIPTTERNGPEVGMAELNSLADLFEGEVPELGMTWQEEETVGETADSYSIPDLETANDFSDFFFEQETLEDAPLAGDEDVSGLLSNSELLLNQVTSTQMEESQLASDSNFFSEAEELELSTNEEINEATLDTAPESSSALFDTSDSIGNGFDNLDELFGDLEEADFAASHLSELDSASGSESFSDLDAIFTASDETSAIESSMDDLGFSWEDEFEAGDRNTNHRQSEIFSSLEPDELVSPSSLEDFSAEDDYALTSLDDFNTFADDTEETDEENVFSLETPINQSANWFVQPDVEIATSRSRNAQWEDAEVTADLWDTSDEEAGLIFDDAGLLENSISDNDDFFNFESDAAVSSAPPFNDVDLPESREFNTNTSSFESDITADNGNEMENFDLSFDDLEQTDNFENLYASAEADELFIASAESNAETEHSEASLLPLESENFEQSVSLNAETELASDNPLFEANFPEFSPLEADSSFELFESTDSETDADQTAELTLPNLESLELTSTAETPETDWFAETANEDDLTDGNWETQFDFESDSDQASSDLFSEASSQLNTPSQLGVNPTDEFNSALEGDFSPEFDDLFAAPRTVDDDSTEEVEVDNRSYEAASLPEQANELTFDQGTADLPIDLETDLDNLFANSFHEIESEHDEFAATDSEFAEFEAELGGLFANETDAIGDGTTHALNSEESNAEASEPVSEVTETSFSILADQSVSDDVADFELAISEDASEIESEFSGDWNDNSDLASDSSDFSIDSPVASSDIEQGNATSEADLNISRLPADSELVSEPEADSGSTIGQDTPDLDLAALFDDNASFDESELVVNRTTEQNVADLDLAELFDDSPSSDESAPIWSDRQDWLPTDVEEESSSESAGEVLDLENLLAESTQAANVDFAATSDVDDADRFDEAVSGTELSAAFDTEADASSIDDFNLDLDFDLEETLSSDESQISNSEPEMLEFPNFDSTETESSLTNGLNFDDVFTGSEVAEAETSSAESEASFDPETESSLTDDLNFDDVFTGSEITEAETSSAESEVSFDMEGAAFDEMMLGFDSPNLTETSESLNEQMISTDVPPDFEPAEIYTSLESDSLDAIASSEEFAESDIETFSDSAIDTDALSDPEDLPEEEPPISPDTLIFDTSSTINRLSSDLEDSAFDSDSSISDLDDFSDLEALLGDELPSSLSIPLAAASPSTAVDEDEFGDLEKLLKDADQKMGGGAITRGNRSAANVPNRRMNRRNSGIGDQNMRVSVKHLDNLNNLVGELVVNRNSLEQAEERLRQFLDNLLYQVQQLSDVGQRMRDLYERSLLESSLLSSRRSYQLSSQTGIPQPQTNHATGVSFDALEMDRFTGFHTLSQEMIELIVRVRESASDIDFVVDETDQITRIFRQITTQLQEGLTRSRMVPFAQIADRLPRAVRDISLQNGKQAELVVEGRDTLIDKMILEQLYDPMTHLVNNAIAHGIETPEQRQAAGKPIVGRITVRAFHQGNQTVISVTDDGAGINPDRVKTKAIEKGLITSDEAAEMSRLDVYDLLFHHGFSTKDKADNIAGRGVGMDVVRTSLNEIRGVINIDSTIGQGTTFTVRLPLTLSISKALCCISNRARIAFPMDGVEDMLDVPKDRIQTDEQGRYCIQWRDMLLPFQPLSDLLKYNRILGRGSVYGGNQEEDIVSVVVLRSNAGNFLALQVDQVLGEQEIVIKQLEGPVPKPTGVAGATVLGDGRIMPIADVLELIDLSLGRIRREAGNSLWDKSDDQVPVEAPPTKTEPTVLIVDDSITVRELLSMTFNKVGYRVEQARDGQEAWEKLRSGLPCDLVFCDIEMPRMDGLELLARIQKDAHLNNLPIAMLTSRGAERHRQMAVQLGAKGYFTKPYLEEALLDAAQRMLKGEVLVSING